MSFVDYYRILGISRNASSFEIEHAITGHYNSADFTGDYQKLNEINVALDILCNPTKKAEYDIFYDQHQLQQQQHHHVEPAGILYKNYFEEPCENHSRPACVRRGRKKNEKDSPITVKSVYSMNLSRDVSKPKKDEDSIPQSDSEPLPPRLSSVAWNPEFVFTNDKREEASDIRNFLLLEEPIYRPASYESQNEKQNEAPKNTVVGKKYLPIAGNKEAKETGPQNDPGYIEESSRATQPSSKRPNVDASSVERNTFEEPLPYGDENLPSDYPDASSNSDDDWE